MRELDPKQGWHALDACCREAMQRAAATGGLTYDSEYVGCCEWMGDDIWGWSEERGYILTDFAREWLAQAGVTRMGGDAEGGSGERSELARDPEGDAPSPSSSSTVIEDQQ